jgi:hypothetical protein
VDCLLFPETPFVFEEFGQQLAAFFREDATKNFAAMIEPWVGE